MHLRKIIHESMSMLYNSCGLKCTFEWDESCCEQKSLTIRKKKVFFLWITRKTFFNKKNAECILKKLIVHIDYMSRVYMLLNVSIMWHLSWNAKFLMHINEMQLKCFKGVLMLFWWDVQETCLCWSN